MNFPPEGKAGRKVTESYGRYSILSNAYASWKFDRLLDRDHAAGTVEDEKQLVFQLVTLY